MLSHLNIILVQGKTSYAYIYTAHTDDHSFLFVGSFRRATNKSGRMGTDAGSDFSQKLPVWKTAAVLLVRSWKAGYGM